MPTVRTADGIDIAWEEKGRSDGLPSVLLHGFSANAGVWAETASALAPRFRVLLPELRGHGSSGRTEEPADFTVDRLISDVVTLSDTLALAPATLIGHRLGGLVAVGTALLHPDRVAALVLVATGPRPIAPDSGPGRTRRYLAEIVRDRGMEAAWGVYVDDGLVGLEMDRVPEEIAAAWREEFLRTAPAAFLGLAADLEVQEDLTGRLGALEIPVLVVVGEDDGAYGPGAREMAEAIPGAGLAVIRGGGQSPQLDRAEEFNRVVLEFLKAAV